METVKGIFQNGVACPTEPVEGHEGQQVTIIFLEESQTEEPPPMTEEDWEALVKLLRDCAMDTGIPDLAHQHDHYLYGTPKKKE